MQEAVRLGRTAQAVDVPVVPGRGDGPGVLAEAVDELTLARRLGKILHAAGRGHGRAIAQADVLGRERLGEDHRAGAVGDGVEILHRHAAAVIQHPDRAAADVSHRHAAQRAARVGLHGGRLRQLLEIIPEGAAPQPHDHRGKARRDSVQRPLQKRRIDRVGKAKGDAVGVAPVPPQRGGKDERGVIQPHPAQIALVLLHGKDSCLLGLDDMDYTPHFDIRPARESGSRAHAADPGAGESRLPPGERRVFPLPDGGQGRDD